MNQFEEIRVFVELINSGSAVRAAERLGLANSAISRRLKELESRLGTQLIQRTTRSMRLTDAGRQYYQRCVQILGDLQEANEEITDQGAESTGRLSIATPWSFGVSYLSPAITEFMHRHPKLEMNLDMNDRRVDLINEGFDLAVRVGHMEDSSLIARTISTVSHIVCGSPDYLRLHGTPKTTDDLKDHAVLCYSNLKPADQWVYVDAAGATHNVKVRARMRASNGDALCQAAVAGLGLLCEPDFIVSRAIRQGLLVPILTDYNWYQMGIYALYPQTRYLSRNTRAFIDFLVESFSQNPEWQLLERNGPTVTNQSN